MAEGFILSKADKELLQRLIAREKRGSNLPPRTRSSSLDSDELWTPEVYVARVPAGGIWPMSGELSTGTGTGTGTQVGEGNSPGWAECDIYRTDTTSQTPNLIDMGFTRRVHNLTFDTIPADTWVLAVRDKWGTWYIPPWYSTGGSAVDVIPDQDEVCNFVSLKSTDCLEAVGLSQTIFLSKVGSNWTSSPDEFLYGTDTGTGPGPDTGILLFNYSAGAVHLFLDGLELLHCGGNCWAGGPLTGHADNTPVGAQDCIGTIFTICLTCTCCPVDGWGGEGWYAVDDDGNCIAVFLEEADKCSDIVIIDGPFATEELAEEACPSGNLTDCCPGVEIPSALTAIANSVGNCDNCTINLTFVGSTSDHPHYGSGVPIIYWEGSSACGDGTITLTLACLTTPNTWGLAMDCTVGSSTADGSLNVGNDSCNPFYQEWTVVADEPPVTNCCDNEAVVWTIEPT